MKQLKGNTERANIKLLRLYEADFFIDSQYADSSHYDNPYDNYNVAFAFYFIRPTQADVIEVRMKVAYFPLIEGEDIHKEILNLEVGGEFFIENVDTHFDIDENKITDKTGITTIIIETLSGAIRGMLAIRTAGTRLSKFPLPLFDVEQCRSAFDEKNE